MTLAVGMAEPSKPPTELQLAEWTDIAPGPTGLGRLLSGASFHTDSVARTHAAELEKAGVVTITERVDGLAISTRSFVGRVRVGLLDLTIVPKISWERWLTLAGYALRLRGLVRGQRVSVRLDALSLRDLIILELVAEARDLIARGLQREYIRHRAPLSAPRGRIDIARIARRGGITEAAIPCRYTRRSDDSALNKALLAGLRFAVSRATDPTLRADARRLAHQMELTVRAPNLSEQLLERARSAIDRRTTRYVAALQLIRVLLDGETVTLDGRPDSPRISIAGFALDMNRIWQQLLARVLREWSHDLKVREEFALRDVFQRNVSYPFRRPLPIPRPDFAAFHRGQLIGYLDAKYRDLWELPLPREMLYQVALYALSQGRGAAAILYPSHSPAAREQRLDIRDPVSGQGRGSVALRPVSLAALEGLIRMPAIRGRTEARSAFARSIVTTN